MTRISIVPAVAAVMGAILMSGQAGAYPGNTVEDGIGYRSNLIDPHNPYASSERRNFGVLLARLGMLGDWTDIGGAATVPARAAPSDSGQGEAAILEGPDYTSYLHDVLAPLRLDDLFPYEPSYRDCPWTWTPHETTRRYMRALTTAHAPHEMRARLIAARHRLVPDRWRCPDVDSMDGYLEALRAIDGRQWRPWRDYLEGAAHFYAEDYDSAADAFARIARTNTWLGAAAAYMLVRTARYRFQEFENDRFWMEDEHDNHDEGEAYWRRLVGAIEDFETSGLDWGYRDAALGLRMYAAAKSRDRDRAEALYFAELERRLGPGADAGQAESLFYQFSPHHTTWDDVIGLPWDNPLWQVNRLLVALVRAGKYHDVPSHSTVEATAATLSASLASGAAAFDVYPGLAVYARVLLAFANEDHGQVVSSVPAVAAGAEHFLPDMLLLKARSQAELGEHWDAAMTWRGIALRWPALNAMAEAGRAAVKASRFADFALLDWDLTAAPDGRDPYSLPYHDRVNQYLGANSLREPPWSRRYSGADYEMGGPARFLDERRPIHNVLREGLARFTAPDRSIEIARDPSLPPALRWYALEPLLRASLVGGDYRAFVDLAPLTEQVQRDLKARSVRWWQGPEALSRWRDILPSARRLTHDAGHAESLMKVGRFLYGNHIYPVCERENATLWSRELGSCTNDGPGRRRGPAPMALFERARIAFDGRRTRVAAEGRLLRMMVHCYRTERDRESCLRESRIGEDEQTRAGWFRRLHEHFPESARKTPRWW